MEMISNNFLLLTLYTSHIFIVIFSNVITFGFCRKWARWYLSLTWYGQNNYKRDSCQDIMIQCTPEILKPKILFNENNSLFEASFLCEKYFIKTLVASSYWTYFQYLWNLCGWGKIGLSYGLGPYGPAVSGISCFQATRNRKIHTVSCSSTRGIQEIPMLRHF